MTFRGRGLRPAPPPAAGEPAWQGYPAGAQVLVTGGFVVGAGVGGPRLPERCVAGALAWRLGIGCGQRLAVVAGQRVCGRRGQAQGGGGQDPGPEVLGNSSYASHGFYLISFTAFPLLLIVSLGPRRSGTGCPRLRRLQSHPALGKLEMIFQCFPTTHPYPLRWNHPPCREREGDISREVHHPRSGPKLQSHPGPRSLPAHRLPDGAGHPGC